MKYYIKHLHESIKDKYFKNFGFLQIHDDIIKGHIDFKIIEKLKNEKLTSTLSEFRKEIEDYCNLLDEEFNQSVKSKVMKDIEYQLIIAEDMIYNIMLDQDCYLTNEVIEILKYSNASCIVGGAVRDMIVGNVPHDFDFVTDIDYDKLIEIFNNNNFEIKETGKTFRVLNIIKGGKTFEIANFRKDGTYLDGRRPESTEIGTIEDDAARRDFTINALYYNLTTQSIIDPTGNGIIDRSNHLLRFVGNPKERLNEDLLRVYRFYRFLSKGLIADKKSLQACREMFECAQKKVSPQRVLMELEKMRRNNDTE